MFDKCLCMLSILYVCKIYVHPSIDILNGYLVVARTIQHRAAEHSGCFHGAHAVRHYRQLRDTDAPNQWNHVFDIQVAPAGLMAGYAHLDCYVLNSAEQSGENVALSGLEMQDKGDGSCFWWLTQRCARASSIQSQAAAVDSSLLDCSWRQVIFTAVRRSSTNSERKLFYSAGKTWADSDTDWLGCRQTQVSSDRNRRRRNQTHTGKDKLCHRQTQADTNADRPRQQTDTGRLRCRQTQADSESDRLRCKHTQT